jgi:hypothetical protein
MKVSVWRRLYLIYMRLRGLRYWIAASPSGNVDLGFLTDAQALEAGTKLGKVAYIDRDACIVFFDAVPITQTERY